MITIIALGWGGLMNGYLLTRAIAPRGFAPVAILDTLADWLTLASLLVFAVVLALRGSRLTLLWLTPGVIAFVFWTAPAWLPPRTPETTGPTFTVATFNVKGFPQSSTAPADVIANLDTDLIGLQEVQPALATEIQTTLKDQYPYRLFDVVPGFDGLALLSRYPILDADCHADTTYDDRTTPRYIRAVIDLDGRDLVVYVLHLPVPVDGPYAKRPSELLTNFDDSHQHIHAQNVLNLIHAETDPVLVLCDCNSTPHSRQYALLDSELNEAFGTAGWGLGFTHPVNPFPVLRIDYIWYNEALAARQAHVGREASTSDHYPLWAEIGFAP